MAQKKAASSSKNGRDSRSRRLGVKNFGGQFVIAGNIIVRQVGGNFIAGHNVNKGKDYTLSSLVDGHVNFREIRLRGKHRRVVVSVETVAEISTDEVAEISTDEVAEISTDEVENTDNKIAS